MGSRMQPSSNIFIPNPNFGRTPYGYMQIPGFNSNMMTYQYQQFQGQTHPLLNNTSPQPIQSITHFGMQHSGSTPNIINNISSATTMPITSVVTPSSTSASTSSSSTTSTSSTSTNAKTNTPYSTFTLKNLDQSSNYFSECTHKDFLGPKKSIKSIGWSCDGKKIAGGSFDHTVRVWPVDQLISAPSHTPTNNTPIRIKDMELKGHTDSVESLAWHPTHPDTLATASSDKTIRIWDTKAGKCISTINTSVENINIAWYPDGSFLATGSKDDYINIYDVKAQKCVRTIKFQDEVNEFSWDSKGELLFLTTGLGNIEVYRFIAKNAELKYLRVFTAHTSNIYCLDFHPSKKYFALGSADSVISLWDIEEMCCIKTFCKQVAPIRSISFSFDGQFIVSTSEDNIIDISHVESGQSVHQVQYDIPSSSIAWSPNQPLIAIAYEGKDSSQKESGVLRVFGFHS